MFVWLVWWLVFGGVWGGEGFGGEVVAVAEPAQGSGDAEVAGGVLV